jgi:hypothetical protein
MKNGRTTSDGVVDKRRLPISVEICRVSRQQGMATRSPAAKKGFGLSSLAKEILQQLEELILRPIVRHGIITKPCKYRVAMRNMLD